MNQEKSVHSNNGEPSNLYLLLEEAQEKRRLYPCESDFFDGRPDAGSFYACPCWRVTTEMAATDTLPDHVGLQAMAQSCQTWAQKHYTGGTGPYILYAGDALRAKLEHIEVGGGPGGGMTDFATDWPVPLLGSPLQIRMVIRQRVELSDTEDRARYKLIVSDEPQWVNAMRQIAREAEPRLSLRNAIATQGRMTWQEQPLSVLQGTARRVLASYSLPTTPSVIGYALETAIPTSPYRREFLKMQQGGPAPGLLVETLFLLDPSLDTPHGDAHSSISGGAFEGNIELWGEAVRVVTRHREWWASCLEIVNTDMRRFNSRQRSLLWYDVRDCVAGSITKSQVIERERTRDQNNKGRPLTENEERQVQDRVRKSMSRERNKPAK